MCIMECFLGEELVDTLWALDLMSSEMEGKVKQRR